MVQPNDSQALNYGEQNGGQWTEWGLSRVNLYTKSEYNMPKKIIIIYLSAATARIVFGTI